jgi:two-component system response regulator (stage 0 sporulation protein A)
MRRYKLITEILLELGLRRELKGFLYIMEAVTIMLEGDGSPIHITKDIYPEIAKKNKDSVTAVERAIRHAIEKAFDVCPIETIYKYFGNSISVNKGKPTNYHFIVTVAELVKQKEGDKQ